MKLPWANESSAVQMDASTEALTLVVTFDGSEYTKWGRKLRFSQRRLLSVMYRYFFSGHAALSQHLPIRVVAKSKA
jgi:hypothetical protein